MNHLEHMTIYTSSLSDDYLEALAGFAQVLSHGDDVSGEARAFSLELLSAVRSVQTRRHLQWFDYVDSTGFPDWDTCVAALRSVGDDE